MRTPLRSYNIKRSTGGRIQLQEDSFYSRRRVEKVEKQKAEDKAERAAQ